MRRKSRLSIQRVIGVDAPRKELCERELGGCICESGPVWGSLTRCILKQSGAGLGTRREGSGEDASLEKLGKGELCGGISERDFHRVSSVAGGLCFMKAEWNCTPEGVFGKTQLQKLRDGELRRGVCCGSVVC